jgi:hypothetical protein
MRLNSIPIGTQIPPKVGSHMLSMLIVIKVNIPKLRYFFIEHTSRVGC